MYSAPRALPPQEGPSRHPLRSPAASNMAFHTAEPLTAPMVTGTFLVGPVSGSSALPCPSPPALFNKEPTSVQTGLEETVLTPGR